MKATKSEKIRKNLYEFMGYCATRYNVNKEIALTAGDIKIVEQYVTKIVQETK